MTMNNIYAKRRRVFKTISATLSAISLFILISTAGLSDNNMISFNDTIFRVVIATIIFLVNWGIYNMINNYEDNLEKKRRRDGNVR